MADNRRLAAAPYAATRILSRADPSPARGVSLLVLVGFTFMFVLVLGGESMPRPGRRDAIGTLTLLATILAVIAVTVLAMASIVIAGLRTRVRDADFRVAIGPGLIKAAIGISGFVLIFAAWTVAMATTTPRVHPPVTLALFFGGPVALLPLGASVYRAVLARWETDVLPAPLVLGLDRLRDRTGCIFDRVLCLDAAFGSGRLCEVVSTPRQTTLIVSAGVTELLEPDELLAILAHEAAHVQLRHLRRKLAVGLPAGTVSVAAAVALGMVVSSWWPRSLALPALLSAVVPVVLARMFYDMFVTRAHEAEADEFAVRVAGADALLRALERIGGQGFSSGQVHDRWTTHSTWETRSARIRAAEGAGQRAPAGE